MRSLLRVSSSLLVALALALAVGCKQGEGERCQTDDDCEEGLICSVTTTPPTCTNPVNNTFPDAAIIDTGVPVPDARPADASGPDAAAPDAAPPDAMP